MSESSQSSGPHLDASTALAVERTRLAHDRNMMSWIRTSASLITFGFSIDRFFDIARPGGNPRPRLFGPREFAIFLIVVGLASLVLGVIEHRRSLRELCEIYGGVPPRTPARIIAALVAALGVGSLVVAVMRL